MRFRRHVQHRARSRRPAESRTSPRGAHHHAAGSARLAVDRRSTVPTGAAVRRHHLAANQLVVVILPVRQLHAARPGRSRTPAPANAFRLVDRADAGESDHRPALVHPIVDVTSLTTRPVGEPRATARRPSRSAHRRSRCAGLTITSPPSHASGPRRRPGSARPSADLAVHAAVQLSGRRSSRMSSCTRLPSASPAASAASAAPPRCGPAGR